jgi:4-amino-4-deoxy-L-arabinose transferase-like glycosyltransferase
MIRRKDAWVLAALLAWAIVLRINHLGTIFFNGDEPFFQVRISYQPLGYVLKYNSDPLFSVLVHFLLPLGSLEIMARLLSFLAGVLAVVVTYLLGKKMASRTTGFVAALFVASSHLLVFYSQNSRPYALLTLLFLLSTYFLYKAAREGALRDWVLFGISLVLFFYSHIIAFLSFPAFVLFIAVVWLEGRKKAVGGGTASARPKVLRNFLISTGAAAFVTALLYIPCAYVTDMLFGTLGQGIAETADTVRLSLLQIRNILQLEISPLNAAIFTLTMAFFLIGSFARLKTFKRESVLLLGAIVIPWAAFVLGKPRASAVTALYRFLQHLLPLIFIAAARGIEVLGTAAATLAARNRSRRRNIIAGVLIIVAALVLARGYFSNLAGYYYADYWRAGSFAFDSDVKAYLKEHARRDAVLFIDSYPASTGLLNLNPVSQDLRPDEIVIEAREDYLRPPGRGDVIIHTSSWSRFYWNMAAARIELWAVTPKAHANSSVWRSRQVLKPHFELIDLKKSTLLHFQKDEFTISEKMAALADLLIAAPEGDGIAERQRLLFAARMYLMARSLPDGLRILKEFESVPVEDKADASNGGGAVDRILGRLLGFSPRSLRNVYERRALEEIQSLLFKMGGDFSDADRRSEALTAYEEGVRLGGSPDPRIIDGLVALGDRFEKAGERPGALKAWETALKLDPKRKDIRARIAGARLK